MDESHTIEDLRELMRRLRDPEGGCPWDRQQNFHTIIRYSIEEIYELADAIDREDYAAIKDELGDVLFQVIFFSQMGQEEARFTLDDVVDNVVRKLLRRHPHVFPDGQLDSRVDEQSIAPAQVKESWEQIKAGERRQKALTGILDDVPAALPALSRAAKLQKRAASVGFDWPERSQIFDKLNEELAELQEAILSRQGDQIEEELGDLLFCCVNLARRLSVDSETALRGANRKFESRFRYIEQRLADGGKSIEKASLEEMDALWDAAKISMKTPGNKKPGQR